MPRNSPRTHIRRRSKCNNQSTLHERLSAMIEHLEREGIKVCNRIAEYSKRWKQPVNVQKTVGQMFHSQIEKPKVEICMENQKLEIVKEHKYLGFTWTSKLSLRPTVDQCIAKADKALAKLKWMKCGRKVTSKVLRKCFFVHVFPHLAWIFPFYPLLPKTQAEKLDRKFRVGIRMIHRYPFVPSSDVFTLTIENPLDFCLKRYIKKRVKNIHTTDQAGAAEWFLGWGGSSHFIDFWRGSIDFFVSFCWEKTIF